MRKRGVVGGKGAGEEERAADGASTWISAIRRKLAVAPVAIARSAPPPLLAFLAFSFPNEMAGKGSLGTRRQWREVSIGFLAQFQEGQKKKKKGLELRCVLQCQSVGRDYKTGSVNSKAGLKLLLALLPPPPSTPTHTRVQYIFCSFPVIPQRWCSYHHQSPAFTHQKIA